MINSDRLCFILKILFHSKYHSAGMLQSHRLRGESIVDTMCDCCTEYIGLLLQTRMLALISQHK